MFRRKHESSDDAERTFWADKAAARRAEKFGMSEAATEWEAKAAMTAREWAKLRKQGR
ncbi:hypothetical protein [Streptomyces sp. RTd22]|uniref:hypothetical protein n=1 Tax=Streptomyces sp. RTd22 TaxID=1841249 RepID=UPI000A6E143B|nr:hypothetical protein [Streptomyces sp. RTd22]